MGKQRFERLGYYVTICNDSKKALDFLRSAPQDFDLVVTDMTMPDMTMPDMTGDIMDVEMMKIRPEIPVILCTGYSSRISVETARRQASGPLPINPLQGRNWQRR